MNVEDIVEELQIMIYYELVMQSPILSGNMQAYISSMGLYSQDPSRNEARVLITAPAYDLKEWEKSGKIIPSGGPNYAYSVNEYGGFGRHNRSEHWVNRVINECCERIALKYGGKVEFKLPD